jgi:magnesium chelatase accessory protein
MNAQALVWERDGRDWPHRERSRHVAAAGLSWHVQHWPCEAANPDQGPVPHVLLIHGTGAATHSWRTLAPLLARHADVLAFDLPGHGFTSTPAPHWHTLQFSLPGMAAAVAELLHTVGFEPSLLVGHSAGAAIAVQLCLDGHVHPDAVIGLNAALLPMGGLVGPLFAPAARLLASSSRVPLWFAQRAHQPQVLQRLMDSTGSQIDATGMALYGRLVGNPVHAAGALAMMAHWDLYTLARALRRLQTPLQLVVGERDLTVRPEQAQRVWERMPASARRPVLRLPGLGHLAHEEDPQRVAEIVGQWQPG